MTVGKGGSHDLTPTPFCHNHSGGLIQWNQKICKMNIPAEEQMWHMTPSELREACESMIEQVESARAQYLISASNPDLLHAIKTSIDYLENRQEFCCALAAYKERNTSAA